MRSRCTNCSRFSYRVFCESCVRSLAADGYDLENDLLPGKEKLAGKREARFGRGESGLIPLPPPRSRRRWFWLF